eukprot:TRINITY_DN51452_c0_g1_i1.p1 TRINITY_DN51452_c0_g1~~TRINITY_DN51452_c0_g1_i1.p1  ORF type:complete len:508 (-),score=70.06 TRINITY_DN51452_c0_g1_i1:248-1771(-)
MPMPVQKGILKKPGTKKAGTAVLKSANALFKPGRVDRSVVKRATKMTREQFVKLQVGMEEKWPLPPYMNGQRGTTQYRDDTFMIITRWTAETRIAYRPHAKTPGSKSHLRYEKYSHARTVGEALHLGSYPADWCWDYERGFIRVIGGPIRDEPLDVSKGDEDKVTPVDLVIYTWYKRELAKMLCMKPKELSDSAGWGESVHIRALRLLAQRESKARLEAADREGRLITDEEVFLTLKRWPFFRNPWRKNVMQEGKTWVYSDTLGMLRDRAGDVHLTAPTRRYPQVAEILTRWLTDRLPKETRSFGFTSINVNCNYAAATHRDNGNFGPSFIKAFGEFTGGELNYWPEDAGGDLKSLPQRKKVSFDIQKNLALFNGNCAHSVNAFSGSRYSLVYFSLGCHANIKPEEQKKLRMLGFPTPAPDADPHEILRPPRGYASNHVIAAAEKRPAFILYNTSELEKGWRCPQPKSSAVLNKMMVGRLQPEDAKSFYRADQRRARKDETDVQMEY